MKSILLRINPMKESTNNSKLCFGIQKLLAFFMIYIVASIVLEIDVLSKVIAFAVGFRP